ncbi:S-layer homology domain-containing protein [Paenibacillus sp. NPDC057967]|uniref:S-layer homology domain-containing protein n=1 Tax=Paenibacillus sp. NPDC057967 TaxID=3346293 RepID=UPI0036DACE8E
MFRKWRKHQWLLVVLAIVVMSGAVVPSVGVSAAEGTEAGDGKVTIVDKGSTWSYSDEGIDYSDAMKNVAFDYAAWKVGVAPFGYKVSGGKTTNEVAPASVFDKVATITSFGDDASKKHLTSYFSKIIQIEDVNAFASYEATLGVDDGIVLYANGVEVYRAGMAEGEVGYDTLATSGKDKPVVYTADLTSALKAALRSGDNKLTAEVHNQSLSSSDLYFDMMLTGVKGAVTEPVEPLEVVKKGASWSYSDIGIDYSAAMKDAAYDFTTWDIDLAPFGYKVKSNVPTNEVGPDSIFDKVATIISYGGDASKKHITSYFSKKVTIDDVSLYDSYETVFGVDDGMVFYVNGVEVFRAGLPEGEIGYDTVATTSKDLPIIYTPDLTDALKGALRDGENVLAVEVHNQSLSSSDLYFDMMMTALPPGEDGGEGGGEPPVEEGKNIALLPKNSVWKYLDNGSDQGTAWRAVSFDDAAWNAGPAPLGYPASDATTLFGSMKTVVSFGGDSSKKHRTTYYRTTFQVEDLTLITKLFGQFGVDDGVVLYANGVEVYRFNMPEGEPDYQTLSATTLGSPTTETADLTGNMLSVLKQGTNVLAAEVHQRSDSSSDLYWDMQLIGNPVGLTPESSGDLIPTAIALTYNGDPSSAQGFAWYTDSSITGTKLQVAEASKVAGNTMPVADTITFNGTSTEIYVFQSREDKSAGKRISYASHKATATGLKPNTTYSYRLGDGQEGHWSEIRTFKTANPSADAFQFLYMTDTQGTTASDYVTWKHTLDEAMKTFPASEFFTLTGDLVDHGDIEDQWMWLLNTPQDTLRSLPFVPALGNHESKLNNNFWYHFNVPNVSYTGAKPDGSVYSFEYGDAQFMIINTEYNEVNGVDVVYKKQEEWLRAEAAKSNKPWKIVLFHKSPYSVASHTNDSDVLFFRDKLTKLFDEIGIDVVLSGHDHTYTRTYPMYDNAPQKDTVKDADGSMLNPLGTMYLVSNAAGDKRYTPKAGPFPFAEKYGQPGTEMFTGITVTDNVMSFQVYTTSENGSTELYDEFSIKKTTPQPNKVRNATISAIKDGKATLTWNAPQGNTAVDAYRIYEKTDKLGPNWNARVVPAGGASSFTYEVTGLDATAKYEFVIKALVGKSNSEPEVAVASSGNGGNNGGGNGGNNGGNNGNGNEGNNGGNNGGSEGSNGGESGGGEGNGPGTPAPTVTDIANHWASSSIERALKSGIVNGYGDGTFRPDHGASRAEFVAMLVRALELPAAQAGTAFADQERIPAWSQQAIAQAVEAGLIGGYDDGTFRPSGQVKRSELAVMIARAAALKIDPAAKLSFSDAGEVPQWAIPYVAAVYEAGLMQGKGNNRFDPSAGMTRAEAVTVLLKLQEFQEKK